MTESKTYEIECLIHDLIRQYPAWPSTFSTCECKRMMARGGGKCAMCYEEELAKRIDGELAADIHEAIKHLAKLKDDALELKRMMSCQ